MSNLHLNLKGEYFDKIKTGKKKWEYRLYNNYWKKRLTCENGVRFKRFTNIILRRGYPAKDDLGKQIIRPFKEIKITTILHPHFGKDAVDVFAIKVN
jgi:hypothetical protein